MKIFKIILAAMLAVVSLLAALSEDRIKPSMQEATQSVITVLKDKSLSDNDKIDKIFAVFDPFFDFNQMAKIALSKRYKNLTDEQRTAFGEAFERKLKASYVDKLLGYTDQEIIFKDASKPNVGRYWLNGELLSGGETYGFVYKFYDAKAVELVEKIDYDFTVATNDSLMSYGVIARTLVFDELVKEFIDENPTCTVVNIACGLDTRFYRMDNGKITWYNLDLPETVEVRNQIFAESGRVSNIGISATESAWAKEIKADGNILFIIEGLSMYLTREDNAQMLRIIRENFDNAYVLMECLSKRWVAKENVEKSIQKTGAKFIFGADSFDDIKDIARGFRSVQDDDITRGMSAIFPVLKLINWLPIAHKLSQKILIFEKV